MSKYILESRATAFYETWDEDEGRVLERIGNGFLVLFEDGTIAFFKKKLRGGHNAEAEHCYPISSVVKFKGYSDGFDAEVYFEATRDEPAEVVTYFYELKGETPKWQQILSKRQTKKPDVKPAAPPSVVTREREIIREVVVKVRCTDCGTLYDERDNKCPNCGVGGGLRVPMAETRAISGGCPKCGSSQADFLGIAEKGSRRFTGAIPQVFGIESKSNDQVAYYRCTNCNTTYYTKPTKGI